MIKLTPEKPPYYENVPQVAQTKIYRAILEASGTDNPSAIILLNTINETITWTRDSTGVYTGTKPTPFDENKTTILATSGGDPFVIHSKVSTNNITLQGYDNTWASTDGLDNVSIEIITT